MPNRIIREGILTSEAVNNLSDFGEIFYRRLLNKVDDFARFDGRVALLRSELFGLQLDRRDEDDIKAALRECVNAGLVTLYEVDEKPYLALTKFNQRTRSQQSRFPAPPGQVDEVAPKPRPKADESFAAFWQAYPRKVGKGQAEKAWTRHKLSQKAADIMAGLERCKKSKQWSEADGKFVPHPTTWLNREGWEDDLDGTSEASVRRDAWKSLGPEKHAQLLEEVKRAEPDVDHRAGVTDTERAMRKLAKKKGWL